MLAPAIANNYTTNNNYTIDLTGQFRRKIEDLMNESVLDSTDLGRGRDSHGQTFTKFKVNKVRKVFPQEAAARHYYTTLNNIARKHPRRLLPVNTQSRWFDSMLDVRANEVFLFHGTDAQKAKAIADSGFKLQVANRGGMYGVGIYFAENADKADRYTSGSPRMMIFARVVVGRACVVTSPQQGIVKPPADRKDSVIAVSTSSMVGVHNLCHQEFIVYDDSQCLPEFLIEYEHEL